MEVIEDSRLHLEVPELRKSLTEISEDEINLPVSDDEDEATAENKAKDAAEKEEAGEGGEMNGVMVLTLLDKIIGAVDQIQQTQAGLEARQRDMERSVTGIQGELTKLSKSHTTTANTVNKMLEKVRKVSVNVKSVRGNLEKQAGQIKRLESNENELLKRRNFKVMIYQDEVKVGSKVNVAKSMKYPEPVEGEAEGELKAAAEEGGEDKEKVNLDLSSDEEEVEIEETIEESRAERIKRSSLQRVQNIKTVFSKGNMEKTKQKTKENLEKTKQKTKENLEKTRMRTKENLEKTRQKTKENLEKTKQKTRENLEKTRHNIEKKMGKLGTRMSVNPERKEKMKTSQKKVMKSFTPDHTIYARSKTAVYKVPPFTFHVKKIREGEVEIQGTEMVEVVGDTEEVENAVMEGEEDAEMEMEAGEMVEEDEDETEDSPEMRALLEKGDELVLVEDHDRDSD
ncbi:caveolae-associated protein 1b [Danio rerio]|uniref:Caveolae-associated protein 1b n=1 Tax=Danio rerio TaxID=7955 RepID=A6NA21_DANRE|nr:caveolae-associated protein 1b [Danio rerio]ABR25264.1 polymerase I and transcript release factor [Danio rerio]|eukprot:NP_001108021.1 polymerase I and transcript release factor [Danio rerio]